MSWFTRVARPARPGRSFRTSLRLEELDLRATPSGLGDPPLVPPPDYPPAIENPAPPGNPTPTQTGPNIDRFGAAEVAHGWYQISGHVTAAAPGGLTVSFDGIPALEGMSTVTDANGNFTYVFQVQTNGNDNGAISAQTVDANGNQSNLAITLIAPTP